ncbi:MAG: biopolymer transport protein ExbD [Granulosicoccus sp.]|jgi:biopolymer transport protein ExbD
MDGAGFTISTPAEYQFYHFLFAFSALLFGQNIFFEFTLSKSKSFRKNTSREFTILHHSRMATWYTLFVGFAWCTTFKLLAFSDVFLLYDFFRIGWWSSILVMLWLHFYMWMNVSKYFRKVYPISILIFFVIGILSLGLAQFDPVPYPDAYRNKARSLMHYKLKINPPITSAVSSKLMHKNVVQTIFLGDPEKDGIPNYGLGDAITTIKNIPISIENFNTKVPKSRRGLITTSLVIDKNLKMKKVYELLKVLSENNRLKISFAALTEGQNNPDVYYEYFDQGLLIAIPPHCNDLKTAIEMINKNPKITAEYLEIFYGESELPYCEFYFPFKSEVFNQGLDYIKISAQNEFIFNDEKIKHEDLFEKIKNVVWEKKEKAIFILDVNNEATYEHYFFLRHEHKRAMNEVRNQEALIRFGKKYAFLEKAKQREIRHDYPMIIEEFLNEEERFIFDFFKNKSSKD